jgi:hypothetical protein
MNIQEKLSIIYFALIPILLSSLIVIFPLLQLFVQVILLTTIDVYTEQLKTNTEKKKYFIYSFLFLSVEYLFIYLLVFGAINADAIGVIIVMFLFSLIFVPLLMLMNSNVYKKYIVKKTERTDVEALRRIAYVSKSPIHLCKHVIANEVWQSLFALPLPQRLQRPFSPLSNIDTFTKLC